MAETAAEGPAVGHPEARRVKAIIAINGSLQEEVARLRAQVRRMEAQRLYPEALARFAIDCMEEIRRLRDQYEQHKGTPAEPAPLTPPSRSIGNDERD